MRKFLLLLLAIATVTATYGQKSLLLASKKGINATCPMVCDAQGLVTMVSAEYNKKSPLFVYNYVIDENRCSMSALKNDVLPAAAEEIVRTLESNSQTRPFLNACIKAKVLILFKYRGSKSGETCSIIYNPKTKKTKVSDIL